MKDIKVLIADDHPLLRGGLCRLLELERGISVVGQANNGLETLRLVEELQPDLVLLDINMPDLNGIEVAKNLRTNFPEIRVLVFTIHDRSSYVNEMIRLGAHGYLLKDAEPNKVIDAIKKIMEGGNSLFSRFDGACYGALPSHGNTVRPIAKCSYD